MKGGDDHNRCTDSKSVNPVCATGSFASEERFSIASKTRRSNADWNRAPTRAMIRPRAKSRTPMIP